MADDASYASFLDQANSDPGAGVQQQQHHQTSTSTAQSRRGRFDPSSSSSGSALPAALQSLPTDTPYVSDTDADWEPAMFSYASDQLPSLEEFKKVLGAKGNDQVEELELGEFDPRGQYGQIVERVREAGKEERGKHEVKVFRVQVDRTRVDYYVLTVGERKLVGVVARAVES